MRLLGTLIGLSLTAALAIASPADASSCSYVASVHTVVINLPGGNDVTTISRDKVGNITNGVNSCGGTVTNTDAIYVRDTTPNRDGNDLVGIDLANGPLGPGIETEKPYGVPEIEILLFLEHGNNFVRVTGSTGPDNISAGVLNPESEPSVGINLNAGPESDPSKVADPDVVYQLANPPNPKANETLQIDGDDGDDTIDASGGPGFDAPVMWDLALFGSGGNDRVTGGGGSDTLQADPGDDVLDGGNGINTANYEGAPNGVNVEFGSAQPQDIGAWGKDQLAHIRVVKGSQYDDVVTGDDSPNGFLGGGGSDLFTGRGDDDAFDGGNGTDTVSYRLPPAGAAKGVTVDLARGIQQNTVGAGHDTIENVENLWGSPFADDLEGDGGPNSIAGFEGKDSVNGKAGDDELAIRDGEGDQATCGDGADRVVADVEGTDSVFNDCETVDLAPFVAPPTGTDPETTPPPGTTPDSVAPVLDGLTLRPSSFSVVRRRRDSLRAPGTDVEYRLSEAAAMTFAVQRCERMRGRACLRWQNARGSFAHAGLPGLNHVHFSGRLRHKRLARARYRLVATATDGAGNRSARRLKRFRVVR